MSAVHPQKGKTMTVLSLKPYYQDKYATIFLGNCLEFGMPRVDLVLTDPPYGLNGGMGGGSRARGKAAYISDFPDTPEYIQQVVVPAFIGFSSRAKIITPGNKNIHLYPPADSFGCLWSKASCGFQRWGYADAHSILYYGISHRQGKTLEPCSFELREAAPKNGHPCPKPIRVWKKLLVKGSEENETILDPFMGSGTTLVAAKQLNRKAIGIEIEEKFCEIAAQRLSQEVLEF